MSQNNSPWPSCWLQWEPSPIQKPPAADRGTGPRRPPQPLDKLVFYILVYLMVFLFVLLIIMFLVIGHLSLRLP